MLLSRDDFRNGVFKRDNYKCVVCGEPAVDAHHILDRKLFNDGGYYLNNGASLCTKDHIRAEKCEISCEEIREFAGIKPKVLPSNFYPENTYDKWGKIMNNYYKYPRTPHLPWSEKCTDDDESLNTVEHFVEKNVIATIKFDGENTTIYKDKIHARSIDSNSHPSRDWVKGMWSKIAYMIPDGWRICGENMFALHTIPYENLSTYFYVYSIWDGTRCLNWDETIEWCELLGLTPMPVFYRGVFTPKEIIHKFPTIYNGDKTEGYVIRLSDEFQYNDFDMSVAKFVRKDFIIKNDKHWSQGKITQNKLKI